MTKYCVKFYRRSMSVDRCSIEVEAETAELALQRVEAWGLGDLDLTDEEENSETLEKEELIESDFDQVLSSDHDYPYPVKDD